MFETAETSGAVIGGATPFVCLAVFCRGAHIQGCWDRMKLGDVHAVGRSRAGSVSGFRVDRPAALDALESLDASVRACRPSCYTAMHSCVHFERRARGQISGVQYF